MIKVAVCGAIGKMGKEVCLAVEECPQTELVAKIDIASEGMYHSIADAHRVEEIYVLVDSAISVILPTANQKIKTESMVLVCESVIGGRVPDAFLNSDSLDEMMNLIP